MLQPNAKRCLARRCENDKLSTPIYLICMWESSRALSFWRISIRFMNPMPSCRLVTLSFFFDSLQSNLWLETYMYHSVNSLPWYDGIAYCPPIKSSVGPNSKLELHQHHRYPFVTLNPYLFDLHVGVESLLQPFHSIACGSQLPLVGTIAVPFDHMWESTPSFPIRCWSDKRYSTPTCD